MRMDLVAAVAAAYFYFNWRYFALVTASLQRPRMSKLPVVGSFLLNYILFIVCSVMEWNLLINWSLVFLLQLGETVLYCKNGWRIPVYFALNGSLYGLTVNIFCRCAVAIAMAQPLSAFDNHISAYGNMKTVPVLLGFLLGGAALHLMALPKPLKRLKILISHPRHLSFQLELMSGMYLYLFLNLLLYQSHGNNVFLKLWGIKSAVFSLVGSYLGLRYSLDMCELSDFREQNRSMRQRLTQSEREEEALRSMAYRDMLTGAYSRQYILEQLDQFIRQGIQFTLCFLDLDHLKGVNDCYGHAEGDRYLVTAARELARTCRKDRDLLARYGGDEFLILFPGTDLSTVETRICQVNHQLLELSRSGAVCFPMSLSHGAVDSRDGADAETLLSAADERMYRGKKEKTSARGKKAVQ